MSTAAATRRKNNIVQLVHEWIIPEVFESGLSHPSYLRPQKRDYAIQPSFLIRACCRKRFIHCWRSRKVSVQTKDLYSNGTKGGQRPFINLNRLDNHVKSEHFKMESLPTVKYLLGKMDDQNRHLLHSTNSQTLPSPLPLQSECRASYCISHSGYVLSQGCSQMS